MIAAGEEGCLTGLGSLQPFLVGAVEELTALLSRRAITDFNDWLVPHPVPHLAPAATTVLAVMRPQPDHADCSGTDCGASQISSRSAY